MPSSNTPILRFVQGQNRYGIYCIPLNAIHRPAAQRILNGRVHEPKTLRFIIEHCGQGDVVSAGAFFGDFLPAISRHLDSSGRLWSFEPNRHNYRCAAITCLMNDLRNVRLTNAALGNTTGTGLLRTVGRSGLALGGASHILTGKRASPQGTERVRVVALDRHIPAGRRLALIHLDVEGHELIALQGAIELIRRDKPVLILETVPDDPWFTAEILSLGYTADSHALHKNTVFRASPQD